MTRGTISCGIINIAVRYYKYIVFKLRILSNLAFGGPTLCCSENLPMLANICCLDLFHFNFVHNRHVSATGYTNVIDYPNLNDLTILDSNHHQTLSSIIKHRIHMSQSGFQECQTNHPSQRRSTWSCVLFRRRVAFDTWERRLSQLIGYSPSYIRTISDSSGTVWRCCHSNILTSHLT